MTTNDTKIRSITWLKRSKKETHPSSGSDIDPVFPTTLDGESYESQAQTGTKIICEASKLFQSFTQLQPRILKCRHADFLTAFYHCGLISISRLFIDPAWLPFDSPLMSETLIKNCTVAALECIEKVSKTAELEALFLLPRLLVLSLEMREQHERNRIAKVFEIVQRKWFAVASTYVSDISLLWEVFKSSEESSSHESIPAPDMRAKPMTIPTSDWTTRLKACRTG